MPARFALLVLLVGTIPLAAKPAHQQALATHLGPFITAKLNDCKTCHVASAVDADGELPHNALGERLVELRRTLQKAGKPTEIVARLELVADEDTDRDGASNLVELLAGRFPGDKADVPSAAERATVAAKLPEWRKFLAAYPWRPFDPVKQPPVPVVQTPGRNPIDAFLAAEQEARGLVPRPEADKATLLRRVTLDLTGLPPTPAELAAFLADTAPTAYEQVVERLLASPRYGERWGRHWMDVWRYSDWAGWEGGKQIRDSQPHIWHWRDWIIEALNTDKPYDRMIQEMLAADEIAPTDPAALRATGFLVRNYKMLSREKWLQDTVDHTFLAFQAVTIGCARCHDHMFDPILQTEYFQVRAVFAPHQVRTDRIPGEADTKKAGLPRAYDADLKVQTFVLVRGDDRKPEKTPQLPGVPAALGGKRFATPTSVALPRTAYAPQRQAFVRQETLAAATALVTAKRAELVQDRARLLARTLTATSTTSAVAALAGLPVLRLALEQRTAEIADAIAQHAALERVLAAEALEDAGETKSAAWIAAATAAGKLQRQAAVTAARAKVATLRVQIAAGPRVPTPALLAQLKSAEVALAAAEKALTQPATAAYTPRPAPAYPATSTGRRTALAKWLTDTQNPLTARVAVNHIWLRHFGQALVPSVFDFGRNGRRPTHPALLDWLAADLMQHNWSMKHLHRLLLTSRTYRQASTPEAGNLNRDRDNLYLWRMSPRRLEAEVVRDSILYVCGSLDETRGGPDIDHHTGLTVPRRSLYFRHAAEKQMEFLKLFDAASVTECYQRKDSIIPQQALALANSPLTIGHGRKLARTLHAKHADGKAFIAARSARCWAATQPRPNLPSVRRF